MPYDYKKLYPEIIGIIICIALGILSGFLSHASDSAWYMSLQKPCYNPPSWVFAPVWTVLYGMIGIVMGRLWKQRFEHQGLMLLFIMQFVCNLAWSPLFFFMRIVLIWHFLISVYYGYCL